MIFSLNKDPAKKLYRQSLDESNTALMVKKQVFNSFNIVFFKGILSFYFKYMTSIS